MQPFLLVIVQVCMVNHCLDAVCTIPDRVVTYRVYTVCFSPEFILHLNVCTKILLSQIQYSFSDMRQNIYCYSLSATCCLLCADFFLEWSFSPSELPLHYEKIKNSTYMVTDISHFYRGGKEEGKMQKSSSF